MARVICFDIETTGFEYLRGDRCIEIGALEIVDGKMTGNNFHEYINPEGKIIPRETYEVHKISNAFLDDKPKMSEIGPKFLDYVGDSIIIAHNGFEFDFPFLNHEFEMLGLPQIPREQQQDTLIIACNRVFNLKTYTLDAIAKFYGISLASRAEGHGALVDSEILAKVYLELENTAPAPEISEIVEKQHAAFLAHPKIGGDFPYRQFPISAEEEKIHEDFMTQFNS